MIRARWMAVALLVSTLFPPIAAWGDAVADAVSATDRGDYAAAFPVFLRLAEQGIAPFQAIVGVMYVNGQGIPQDEIEAVRWFRLAAEQGYADAQHNLGSMYANGKGVAQITFARTCG